MANAENEFVSTECPICASSYTGTVRKAVACENRERCGFRACLQCYCSYLTETPHMPHCMECKVAWGYDYVCDVFTRNFRESVLRKRRKEIYYERERSLLPATQEKMNYFEKKALYEQRLHMLYHRFPRKRHNREIRIHLYNFWKNEGFPLYDQWAVRAFGVPNVGGGAETTEETERAVIHHGACPNGDCNGFINVRYHCTLCKSVICKECHRILRNNNDVAEAEMPTTHQCNEDDKASVRLLLEETKPCPKCRARIYKVDGCNQVYCIHCETAFNWVTGKIDKGPVHTPDYFRRLRERGITERGDARGGPECRTVYMNYRTITQYLVLNPSPPYDRLPYQQFINLYQKFNHLINEVLYQYHIYRHNERETELNESLREEFLRKKCSLDSFKRRLYTKYQQNDRNGELSGIRAWIEPAFNDILNETAEEIDRVSLGEGRVRSEADETIATRLFRRLEAFRTFVNDAFINVYKKYRLQVPFLEPDWNTSSYSDSRKPTGATMEEEET